MFLKSVVKTDKSTGKTYHYYRLCESLRIGKSTRHRSILTLGKLEELHSDQERKLLADRIAHLLRHQIGLFDHDTPEAVETLAIQFSNVLRRRASSPESSSPEPAMEQGTAPDHPGPQDYEVLDIGTIRHEDVREIGAEWMCTQAIRELELASFLRSQGMEEEEVSTALMHIVSRAVFPASEHKTRQWISANSAVAELFGKEPSRVSRYKLYNAADQLYDLKEGLEKYLSVKTNELFDLTDKIILYDLTNTYFEGRKANSAIARFGRSKEKRSDCRLVVLALVTNAEGFVKYSRFFSGHTADCTTLADILGTLGSYTPAGDQRPIVALDAGIATTDNLALLKEKGYPYVCVSRTRLRDYKPGTGETIRLYDNRDNPIDIQLVEKTAEGEQGDSFLYVHSQQKAVKEASMKQQDHGHLERQLTALKASLTRKGGVRKYEKIIERIGRIKQRYGKAAQYYEITVTRQDGIATDITWNIIAGKHMPADGVYFLRTSLKGTDERTLWKIYNTLSELEASFRILKTDLNLRPIFHKRDKATQAHLFLGILAYSLVASIRYRLKAKNIYHDWANIVRIMNTQKLVVSTMKNNQGQMILIKACSQPGPQVQEIYSALNYKTLPWRRKKFVFPE